MGRLSGLRWHLLLVLALAGSLTTAEVFDESCFELGKQWIYEAKDMLLCDRSGRRINLNKYCKTHLTTISGRLIIDSSKDESSAEPRKQTGHFPELCLPGQRSHAVQAPFLCTCVMHKGRQRWECVVPEDGAGRGLGGGDVPGGGGSDVSSVDSGGSRRKRSMGDQQQPQQLTEPAGATQEALAFSTLVAEDSANNSVASMAHDIGSTQQPSAPGVGHGRAMSRGTTAVDEGHVAREVTRDATHVTSVPPVAGRQANYRPNIVIDFCDEFGYIHTVSSTVRECSCDKDVISTRMFSVKDNDIYHSSSLFASYECLPGTYNLRCEVCYPETHTCQPVACP